MKALIYGGNGALGRALIKNFAKSWHVASIDFSPNQESHHNLLLDPKDTPNQHVDKIKQQYAQEKFDCIVCAAGGWSGGSIKEDNFLDTYLDMHNKNLIPALISCHLASTLLNEEGILTLVGSSSVFSGPTPTMIGYALAKTGVHTLAMNSFGSLLPKNGAIITILPETLDTEANRQAMPTADFKTWASPDQVSQLIRSWAEGMNRPITGSMAHLRVKNGVVVPEFV